MLQNGLRHDRFDKKVDQVQEIKPGTIVVAKANGDLQVERFADDPARRQVVLLNEFIFRVEMIPIYMLSAKCLGHCSCQMS